MECANCEKNIDRQVSFNVISKKGIIRVCKECFEKEDFPLLKEKNIDPESLYSRKFIFQRKPLKKKENPELKEQEQELKKVASKIYLSQISKSQPEDLIDNFHWIIMRTRRMKKLTQKQFAEKIKEPEIAIKTLEEGKTPARYKEIIKKIETYLGINLIKKKQEDSSNKEEKRLKFDDITTRELTIDDLRQMKKNKEEKIFERNIMPREKPKEDESEFIPTKEKKKEGRGLTQEEINKIIFGK